MRIPRASPCAIADEPWCCDYVRRVYVANFGEDRAIDRHGVIAEIVTELGRPAEEGHSPNAHWSRIRYQDGGDLRGRFEETASPCVHDLRFFGSGQFQITGGFRSLFRIMVVRRVAHVSHEFPCGRWIPAVCRGCGAGVGRLGGCVAAS